MSKEGIIFLIITLAICFGGFALSIYLSMKTNIEEKFEEKEEFSKED